jgi:CHAT domain-containing protein
MVGRIPSYDDLQLRIERGGTENSYRVFASASDGRTARSIFEVPITDDELDDFVRRVGLVRRRGRSEPRQMEDIESLGSKLFNSLIRDEVQAIYQAARAAAAENDQGLRITLRLSDAPELMRLPWEFLYSRPKFLSQSIRTPVVRSLDLAAKRRPLQCDFPLKILGMVSSPEGYAELDADEERRRLDSALDQLKSDGLVELEWLGRATLAELARRISEPDDIHVLHYIGHGAYNEATEGGILVLETPQGRAHDISGADLGTMLQDEESLRLVVLNSCEGARTSRIEPFSGVATSLLEFEIPAVIGMQFEISDEAAIVFSGNLYTGLAHGLPVDAALAPARRAISAQRQTEFGTPVLFLRATDARLFDLQTRPPQTTPKPPENTVAADRNSHDDGRPVRTKTNAVKQGIGVVFRSKVGPRGRWWRWNTIALAVLLATVAAIVAVAHLVSSDKQLYSGYVLPPIEGATGIDVRAEPKLSSAFVGNLPVNTRAYIVCVAIGDWVEGPGPKGQPRISTPIWDKVRTEVNGRDLGFVPDAWVNTGGTQARGPYC